VVVTNALEKYLLEVDVASYTNIFSNHLCKQKQLLIHSFPFPSTFLADTLTKRLQLILKHAGNNAINDLQMHVVG